MPDQFPQPNANPVPTPLARALEQNETTLDDVKQSADELLVINAVLKQEIPGNMQVGDVAQALQHTDALETKISDAAHDLAVVNEVLAQQIDERASLERELAVARTELEHVKHPPA